MARKLRAGTAGTKLKNTSRRCRLLMQMSIDRRRIQAEAAVAERRVCELCGMGWMGGAGRHDCADSRTGTAVEVKNQQRKMYPGEFERTLHGELGRNSGASCVILHLPKSELSQGSIERARELGFGLVTNPDGTVSTAVACLRGAPDKSRVAAAATAERLAKYRYS